MINYTVTSSLWAGWVGVIIILSAGEGCLLPALYPVSYHKASFCGPDVVTPTTTGQLALGRSCQTVFWAWELGVGKDGTQ